VPPYLTYYQLRDHLKYNERNRPGLLNTDEMSGAGYDVVVDVDEEV
jgi:hypothetical protein